MTEKELRAAIQWLLQMADTDTLRTIYFFTLQLAG